MLGMLPDVDGLRILDAGCGSGWYAEQLLKRGASVDGVDASAGMIEFARHRLLDDAHEHKSRLTLRVADLATELPFEDHVFDGIVSPLVLHYLHDWRPALEQMRRVLKPNGWLLLSTHHPAADAARVQTSNYLATEYVVEEWDWVGMVEFFRRPLAEIVQSLTDSGFVIEQLVEPIPTDEFRAAKPEAYNRILSQPEFMIIKARPAQA
jgi:SAM-dependent methyltransferase